MQSFRQFEGVVFQRMNTLQRGTLESQLTFVVFQIIKLFFRDVFIITIFAFPLPALSDAVTSLFSACSTFSVGLSIVSGVFFTGLVVCGSFRSGWVEEKLRKPLQVILPWVDVLAFLFISINIILLVQNASNRVWAVCFNILAIIFASLITIFYTLFNFTKEPRSANLLRRREAELVIASQLITLVLCYYLSAAQSPGVLPHDLGVVFSLLQVGLSVAKIKQRIFRQFYLQAFAQWVSSLFYLFQLNLSLLVAINYIFKLDILNENLAILLVIMTLLEYSALTAFLARRNGNMYLSSAAELKDEERAALYLQRLCELISKVEKEEEDIILISLKKKHSLNCKESECPCQQPALGPFIRHYVRDELELMAEMFHSSPSILLSILYFKMVVFKYYPQILARLAYYSSHFALSIPQRFHRFALTQYLRNYVLKRNYEIDAVESEHMFRLQELRVELEGIIRGEIEVRSKQWKYLARGLCRVSELQLSCNQSLKQMSRVMQIFEESKVKFKKSKEFNLLLLFYFVKVSFLNNGKEVRENLKELYFGFKEDELFSIKEFRKFIYHKRSCVIETLIDNKTMGIITAASRNVEEMFGLPTNKVVGISINNLMPQFMGEEHERVMAEWASSGTWRTIGKLKEIFCVHKEQHCFSALIYLKLYIKDNNLHFITNIFKLNDTDFLLLTPTLKIEGIGKRFLKLLGDPAKRVSLDVLVQNSNGLLSQQGGFAEGRSYRRVFMSLRNMEAEVDSYLQRMNLKFQQQQRKEVNKEFHQKLIALAQERYLVEFTIRRCSMGRIRFLVICLKESKKVEQMNSSFLIKAGTIIDRPHDTSKDIVDEDEGDDSNNLERDDEQDPLILEHNANSSMASLSEKENYPIAKTIEKFVHLVQNPDEIKDSRLSSFNLIVVVILVLLSVIDFLSYYSYKEMLLQIQGIFFADGAQSDIMQTTEIAYNFIYTLRSQVLTAASQKEIASTLQSARLVNTYVYGLREADLASLITNVTELSKDRFYSYLQKPAVWSMQGRPVPVLTHQFLQNMYYLSMRVMRQLQALAAANSTTINHTLFKELFANFPQMQWLNQFYLRDYQQISNRQHDMLSMFTIVSMIVYLVLSLMLGFTFNRYFYFRFNQLIRSFSFFSFVSNHFLEKMKDYYAMLHTVVIQGDRLKNIDQHEDSLFEIDTYDLFHKNDHSKGITSKIKYINYENYYKWIFILLIFTLLNAINYIATSNIRDFFPNSLKIISNINSLMRSENKLLEAYFNLRAAYSLNPNSYLNQSLYDRLIPYLNGTDTTFNSVANQLTTVFSAYDSDYENTFVYTLTTSVCTLSAPSMTPFENSKCVKELSLNILDGGILISMNFFQRSVRTALQDLKVMYMNKSQPAYSGDYFRQLTYVELDSMLIYMFKIYQATQAVTYGSYINTIELITKRYLQLTIGMTVFFILAMLIWLRSIPAQKRNLSYLYGHLLLVPFMILKSNTRISTSLKEVIEYSDL